jgi:uncharacterized protein (DUF2236 family)
MQNKNTEGYFGPDSMTWRLYREPIIMTGSYRALLLQIAHPAVAEGVARFSNFKQDALGRGFRTFLAMATLYFGTRDEADAVGRQLHRAHQGIRGSFEDGHGRQSYQANQSDLKLWVFATLVDTALMVFERAPVPGLPDGWQEQYYEESKSAAAILGIPPEQYPADLAAFRAYMAGMLEGGVLGSTETSRELTQSVVDHFWVIAPLARTFGSAWLPAALSQKLGLPDQVRAERRAGRWFGVIRALYRLLPGPLRYAPAYHQAMYRIAEARKQGRPLAGQFYNWLVRRAHIPLGLPLGSGRK